MKTRFIFNPRSGQGGRRTLPLLRAFASKVADAELKLTEGPGHATALAAEAVNQGCRRVVAVGGDGTMNEVAQALVDTPAALGLVPCGSGNGLARYLRLPGSLLGALDFASGPESNSRALDAGTVNGRFFFNVMGMGLDAEISRKFGSGRRRGLAAYLRVGVSSYFRRKAEHCVVADQGRREALDALLISVANSDQYGSGARVAPGARVDDGLLDLVAIGPVSAPGAILLGFRLFLGSIDRSPRVRHWRGSRFAIERPGPGLVHTDGEIHQMGATLEIAVHPRSLRVMARPDEAAFDAKPRAEADTPCQPFTLKL